MTSTILIHALLPFLVAAVITTLCIPLTMRLAHVIGGIDHPDNHRRIHVDPTPRIGGLAMFAGFIVAALVFGGGFGTRWPVLLCTGLVMVVMLADDLFHVPWRLKLLVEGGVGVLAVVLGISITYLTIPGSNGLNILELGWFSLPLTVIWLAGMQTSINFLDGSDGVAAGVVAIVAGISLLAAINRLGTGGAIQEDVIILSAALMGCCMGFLIFNLPPARIFMGDSGSHFLGVGLGLITILGFSKLSTVLALAVPILALGLPIGDTLAAIIRRRRAGVSIATPDAGHLHHRLLARGMTPLETALTFYFSTAILGCVGLWLYGHRKILLIALGLLIVGMGVLWFRHTRRRLREVRFVQAERLLEGSAEIDGVPEVATAESYQEAEV